MKGHKVARNGTAAAAASCVSETCHVREGETDPRSPPPLNVPRVVASISSLVLFGSDATGSCDSTDEALEWWHWVGDRVIGLVSQFWAVIVDRKTNFTARGIPVD